MPLAVERAADLHEDPLTLRLRLLLGSPQVGKHVLLVPRVGATASRASDRVSEPPRLSSRW